MSSATEQSTTEKAQADAGWQQWQVRYFEPGEIELIDTGKGVIHLVTEDRCWLDVRFRWCFPQSKPGRYLSISTARDDEIGVIREPAQLPKEARRICEFGIELRYFVPKITRIYKADSRAGLVYLITETDRGEKEFAVNDPRENILQPQPGRYLLQDVHGNRYEIEDVSQLDQKSQVEATMLG
ncbi:MAG: DUF1854 domain-containing protein [Armatimonadia bacterium]|nr:DUF1854 domain-containing protein [Armatimonadia bacterium]